MVNEYTSLNEIHRPAASQASGQIAFYYDGNGRNELYTCSPGNEPVQWSDGRVPTDAKWWIKWAPDGQSIYFHIDNKGDDKTDIHRLNADGTSEPIVKLEGQNLIQDTASDPTGLLFLSSSEGQLNLYYTTIKQDTVSQLTDHDTAVSNGVMGPNNELVAYSTRGRQDQRNLDTFITRLGGSSRHILAGKASSETKPISWGPNGEKLLLSDTSEGKVRPGVYDYQQNTVSWITMSGAPIRPVTLFPDGEKILLERKASTTVTPVIYDCTNNSFRNLEVPDGVSRFPYIGNEFIDSTTLLLLHTDSETPKRLIQYNLESDSYDILFEPSNKTFSPEAFTSATQHHVDSFDGTEIDCLFYNPAEGSTPLIVNPHGGPRTADRQAFDMETQYFTTQGYSVLKVNYRGSTGRGQEFRDELINDWGGAEQQDIAAATRHAMALNTVDEDRVAVFGGSYGGYSAYCQVLKYPELYDAGIAWMGMTDLEGLYEETMPNYRTEMLEYYSRH